MKLVSNLIATLAATTALLSLPALAFSPSFPSDDHARTSQLQAKVQTRGDFLSTAATAAAVASTVIIANPTQPAYAQGRATLEQAYDRYTPRIIEGGSFYKKQLYAAIKKGDWKALEAATAEPPKKTKADRKLADGGVAKRAAQAGGFSDARVLTAMDLFASTFSESNISPKTKSMKAEVEKLRAVVEGLNKAARIASGGEKASGGLFGMGSKAPSQGELAKQVKDLYVEGGNAYNQYVFDANEGRPLQLAKIPSI